jgi:uncharacterized membrane protein
VLRMASERTSLQRALVALAGGAVVTAALVWIAPWQLTVTTGWCAAAALFLLRVWPFVLRLPADQVAAWAAREDDTKATAHAVLVGASLASLLGAGFALHKASTVDGLERVLITVAALATVVMSWVVVNTVYTLRYAHVYYTPPAGGIEFADGPPDYRDFAYLAFTVGMTYQVSDTGLLTKRFRRVLLGHALLSYLFGTVIIATLINAVAGFVSG